MLSTNYFLTPLANVGGWASWIVLTFAGSRDTPLDKNTCLKNESELLLSLHLVLLRVSPILSNWRKTDSSVLLCFSHIHCAWDCSQLFGTLHYAEFVPKFNCANLLKPFCIAIVVIYLLSGATDYLWYMKLKSSLENTVESLRAWMRSSPLALGGVLGV